uniref:Protein phosphatase 1 regulatory subunit 14D n=1 Tax=Apteryx owenii TaxID=8824 RepID=A0A8B9PEW6_APTOW
GPLWVRGPGQALSHKSPTPDSSALPRVTFQTPEKPGEESSHRKLGKLTIKYNRKDLQRWLELEEWINAQLQELYQYQVSNWEKSARHTLRERNQNPTERNFSGGGLRARRGSSQLEKPSKGDKVALEQGE